MGGFRAKDADRDRYVEVIQTAYVDGQLGAQDRELRISRALTAETLDELEGLTRDLQNQPAPVVVRPAPAPEAPAPTAAEPVQWPVPPKRGLPTKVVWFVVAGIFGLSVLAIAPSQQSVESRYGEPDFSSIDVDTGVPAAGYELSEADVRTFVRRYEARFDTTEAYRVTLFETHVDVRVPVAGPRPRYEVWSWDGDWRRVERVQVIQGPTGTIDLRTVDVGRLFENIEVARDDLGVADAEVQRVELVGTAVGSGSVTIHVRNGLADRASLETTPQGSRRSP